MDELLAHLQEDSKPSIRRVAKKAIGFIRKALRAMGFNNMTIATDADLFYLLRQARQSVKNNAKASASNKGNGPAFSANNKDNGHYNSQKANTIKVFQVEEDEEDDGNTSIIQSKRSDLGELQKAADHAMFDHAPVQPIVAKQQYADNFKVKYTSAAEKEIAVSIDTVNSPQDAAHIFSAIRKDTQVNFVIMVTAQDGKVLNLIRHTKGLKNQSSVVQ